MTYAYPFFHEICTLKKNINVYQRPSCPTELRMGIIMHA